MKTILRSLLTFIVLLTACNPQAKAPPSPTLALTATHLASTTPEPESLQLREITGISSITKFPVASCSQLVDATISSTGVLEIIYTDSKGPSSPYVPQGFSGFTPGNDSTRLGSWSEANPQKVISFPLPSDALGPRISADHQWIIFRRDVEETLKSEFWVMDTNGQNEKKLATVSFDEVQARYHNVNYANLEYGWVPHTDSIYYTVELVGAGISNNPPTYDAFTLVDIHSGRTTPLAQPGRASNIVFAPDGSQAAVFTANELPQVNAANFGSQPAVQLNGGELRLININDGSVQFTLDVSFRNKLGPKGSGSLAYSADGKYLIGFSNDGILRINAKDGEWKNIPFKYTVVTGFNGDDYSPEFTWVDNSTILVPITNLPEGVSEIDGGTLFGDPEASFTVWRVNLVDAVVQPVQAFKGRTISVNFSADRNFLAFTQWQNPGIGAGAGKLAALHPPSTKLGGAPPSQFLLADLNTGDILPAPEGISFFAWSPYPDRYIYSQLGAQVNGIYPWGIFVGQVRKDPTFIKLVTSYPPLLNATMWVDTERFVMNVGCEISLVSLTYK